MHVRSLDVLRICTVLFTAVLVIGLAGTVSRAAAVWNEVTETGRPGLLKLNTATATPMWATLSPGESTHWLISAQLLTAPRGALQLELSVGGSLIEAGDPTFRVTGCRTGFATDTASPVCGEGGQGSGDGGGGETLVPETSLAGLDGTERFINLDDIVRGEPRELLVTFSLPAAASADEVAGKVANVGLGVHASGDSPKAEPEPPDSPHLPVTGSDAVPLGLLAVGLIGSALCLGAARRQRAEHADVAQHGTPPSRTPA